MCSCDGEEKKVFELELSQRKHQLAINRQEILAYILTIRIQNKSQRKNQLPINRQEILAHILTIGIQVSLRENTSSPFIGKKIHKLESIVAYMLSIVA